MGASMDRPEEGMVQVPGGRLRYRWLPAAPGPVLVFENGWSASLEQWTWMERELAGHASLLSYCHAGVGGSTISREQTVAGLSEQFASMLDGLGIHQPVVLVGHSFGGLISALHAAQQPGRIAGFVQIDNTIEVNDPAIDNSLKMVKPFGALAVFCARLGIRDPLFSQMSRMLPREEGARMQKLAFGSVGSMQASLVELGLLADIRAAIAAAPPVRPRLVISANTFGETGLLGRLLAPSAVQLSKRLQHVQSLHRAQALGAASRWTTLPHNHSDLVFTPAGAADTARAVREFMSRFASVGQG